MPYLAFLFICTVWGSSFILMDRAMLAMGPLAIGLARMLGGAAVLGAYCVATRQWAKLRPGDLWQIVLVGLLAHSYPFVIQPLVMRQADEHAYFGLMVTFVPIFTILLAAPMLGQKPTARQLIGVLGGLLFAGLIVLEGNQRGFAAPLLALAVSVPLSYALGNTYIKWKLDHVPAAPLTTMLLASGGVLLLPLLAAPGFVQWIGAAAPETPQGWSMALASMAVLTVLGTGVAVLLFIHLVKTQGPLFAGMVTYVIPVLAMLFGRVDREPLTKLQMTAVAGMLSMVALVQWGAARSPDIGLPAKKNRTDDSLCESAP